MRGSASCGDSGVVLAGSEENIVGLKGRNGQANEQPMNILFQHQLPFMSQLGMTVIFHCYSKLVLGTTTK